MFFALQLKHVCLKLEDLLWMWVLCSPAELSFSFSFCVHSVTIETKKWLYKRNSYLNLYSHSVKILIGKYSNLTPALNTIRDRHYATTGEFDEGTGLTSSVRKFMFVCSSINRNIFFSERWTPTWVHSPYTDQN